MKCKEHKSTMGAVRRDGEWVFRCWCGSGPSIEIYPGHFIQPKWMHEDYRLSEGDRVCIVYDEKPHPQYQKWTVQQGSHLDGRSLREVREKAVNAWLI